MTQSSNSGGFGGPYLVMGVTQYCRVRGSDTGGAYSVMEHIFPPGTGPAFLHSHPAQESIGIIEGEFEIYSPGPKGKVAQKGGPGTIHHVGAKSPHGLKNVGGKVGRAFVVFHPADVQERFFEDLHVALQGSSGPPNLAVLEPVFARHGFVMIERPA
jgi:quercetin dioxygenase-like cupin family protein